jgi:hypothetical protein
MCHKIREILLVCHQYFERVVEHRSNSRAPKIRAKLVSVLGGQYSGESTAYFKFF